MTAILETRRLRLREFRPDDLDELVADEEQMRFYPGPRTRAEACAWIGRNLSLYEEHGFGFWLIESRPTSEFLGYCGIRPLVLEGASTEIGWHTKKTSWNRGIATKAAAAFKLRNEMVKIGRRASTYDERATTPPAASPLMRRHSEKRDDRRARSRTPSGRAPA